MGRSSSLKFDDLWAVTDKIPDNHGYHRAEGETVFDAINLVAFYKPTILEIGVCYGRSASLLLQMVKEYAGDLTLVDPFPGNPSPMLRAVEELHAINYPFTLHVMESRQVQDWAVPQLDFVHIDGDHTVEGVRIDCERWLPKLRPGGLAAFHDYGEPDGIPSVKEIADKFVGDWQRVAHVDRVAIWRKS